MYHSLVTASGAPFQDAPSWSGSPPDCGSDGGGYSVPITSYDKVDMLTVLSFGMDMLESRGFERPTTFCAGGWAASEELQSALASLDITVSAAAMPPGTDYGGTFGICWSMLCGWGYGTVTHTTPPYLVSEETIMPGGSPPYLVTAHGPLMEIPQVCKVAWMLSADEMKAVFLLNHALAEAGQPTAVSLAVHDFYGHDQFDKLHNVLAFIDGYVDRGGVPVIYATAAEVRDAFLPLLATPGDVDGNGLVNWDDLADVLQSWGPCAAPDDECPADLNTDGYVDIDDLMEVLLHWT
jgi:hypothetical protein